MKKIIFLFFILFIFNISANAKTGSISVKRYDNNGNQLSGEILKNSKVKLFKRNCLIMTLTYDENGEIFVDGLEYAEYKVVEEIQPVGYDLDTYEYVIYLSESKNHLVNIRSKKVEGNLIIKKYYGSDTNYLLDNEAVFELYKNNELIKTLNSEDGVIKEKLDYGNYLIKQVSGKKYYKLSDDINISITKSQTYKYDLYSDVEDELKEMLNETEEQLNIKNQELIDKEKNLNNLKNELEMRESILKKEEEEFNKNKIELEQIKEEINNYNNDLNNKKKLLKEIEKEIEFLKENMNFKKEELSRLEINYTKKENELINVRNELNSLNNKIDDKKKYLIYLESILNNSELKKREEEINDENVLIVEVPDTYEKNYNKLISKILIIMGCLFIVRSKRKVTILN